MRWVSTPVSASSSVITGPKVAVERVAVQCLGVQHLGVQHKLAAL
jgi:hypothetical protein